MIIKSISKSLSENDTGETGAHQAGILVPKNEEILSFFPELGIDQKNPRRFLEFIDSSGKTWEFAFIYYNNKFFGGTRNEYRLTRMTPYMKQNNLKSDDTIIFEKHIHENGEIDHFVKHERNKKQEGTRLKLGSSWKVISI